MKKAVIYARVSIDSQEYQRQINELKSFAERNNMEIKYIFEEKESGFNSDRLEYNKLMQCRSRIGTLWTPATIKSMLENPVYIGKPKYCIKSERRKSQVFNKINSRKILESKTLNHPELAIVTEDIWNASKVARVSRRSRSIAVDVKPYLFQHLIKCPDCNRYYNNYICRQNLQTFSASAYYKATNDVLKALSSTNIK
jgi:hypothetical protein